MQTNLEAGVNVSNQRNLYMPDLNDNDVKLVNEVLNSIARQYESAQSTDFIQEAPLLAQKLPLSLREFLIDFKINRKAVCVVPSSSILGGLDVATPNVHLDSPSQMSEFLHEIYLVLVSSLIGDVFAWQTQQNARYVHDVIPIKKFATEQVGTSSKVELTWHTEDAFHDHRADYLSLLCMRNPQSIATTLCTVNDLDLSSRTVDMLFQKRFFVRPDLSHTPAHNSIETESFKKIIEMNRNPKKISILFGDRDRPYLRIDPDFTDVEEGDEDAVRALAEVIDCINRNLRNLPLKSGDLLFLDNYQCVHGRRAFSANYDGNDRWLKRVNIKKDMRQAHNITIPGTNKII